MSDETVILSTGRILPAATVAAHFRTIGQMASENPQCLHRMIKFSDHRLADHLVEADLFYLHDLGLIEADGRLHPDFRDVLAACVTYSTGC